MRSGRLAVSVSLILGACGDDAGGGGDGGPFDAPFDAPFVPTDIDNGSCGDQIRFTGEYLDWDSHITFCGINDALVEVLDGAMDSTAPNGRFDLCLPDAPTTQLVITQPSGNSQCSIPPSGYTVPTIFVASKNVIQSGGFFSARAFTTERQQTFFNTVVGQPFDSSKAHVFVHIAGMPRTISLAATHGPAQAITATTWAPGAIGHEVFFPNVDVGAGTTVLSVAGGAIGTGPIPLIAGTITNLSINSVLAN